QHKAQQLNLAKKIAGSFQESPPHEIQLSDSTWYLGKLRLEQLLEAGAAKAMFSPRPYHQQQEHGGHSNCMPRSYSNEEEEEKKKKRLICVSYEREGVDGRSKGKIITYTHFPFPSLLHARPNRLPASSASVQPLGIQKLYEFNT
ncbi:hypothetical protein TcCL_NonESM13852, partial [Trypanosoma cruzi]